ncbi:response regulator [Yoonia sp.]|uniref:response regulator n=1 Tax=Yoonia sp. TaxID=2212373 RepID=UPI00391A19DB
MDITDDILVTQAPTATRPLLGLTVLLVEDSRFASEAVRLLCLRSGARIRRADSLQTAARHLAVYRPSVALIDLGLPDGSGLDLIRCLAAATPPVPVVLGISGDAGAGDAVMAAGAHGFIEKPFGNLATFQAAILQHLPASRQPRGPRQITDEQVAPDRIAYHDDLVHVVHLLEQNDGDTALPYVTQFLGGVARSAHDHDMGDAVRAVAQSCRQRHGLQPKLNALSRLVQQRIAAAGSG